MLFIISPDNFEKYQSNQDNKIQNFYNFKYKIDRPKIYNNLNDDNENYDDDGKDLFIINTMLKPRINNDDLKQVYKKNKKLKSIKCIDDKILLSFF